MSAKGILYPVLNVNRERVVQTTKILLSQWRLMVEKETIEAVHPSLGGDLNLGPPAKCANNYIIPHLL